MPGRRQKIRCVFETFSREQCLLFTWLLNFWQYSHDDISDEFSLVQPSASVVYYKIENYHCTTNSIIYSLKKKLKSYFARCLYTFAWKPKLRTDQKKRLAIFIVNRATTEFASKSCSNICRWNINMLEMGTDYQ